MYSCFFPHLSEHIDIVKRNNELLTKNSMLGEINEKLVKVNKHLTNAKDQLRQQYEQHKQIYLASDDVKARIERIKNQMNINFPRLLFEPIAPEDEFEQELPRSTVTSTIVKKKNCRVSMYDAEPSMIDFCDVSGYAFNPPSDQEFSFSPNTNITRPESMRRVSNIFDRNFGI